MITTLSISLVDDKIVLLDGRNKTLEQLQTTKQKVFQVKDKNNKVNQADANQRNDSGPAAAKKNALSNAMLLANKTNEQLKLKQECAKIKESKLKQQKLWVQEKRKLEKLQHRPDLQSNNNQLELNYETASQAIDINDTEAEDVVLSAPINCACDLPAKL